MYVNKDSLGTNPQICKTGPIYGKSGLTCPGGILRKKYALRKNVLDHDKVLTEFHEYHSRITHNHIRHFVTSISFEDAALVIMFIVRTEVVPKFPSRTALPPVNFRRRRKMKSSSKN